MRSIFDKAFSTAKLASDPRHDSPEHVGRVLALAERLREDGVDAQLDHTFAGHPPKPGLVGCWTD